MPLHPGAAFWLEGRVLEIVKVQALRLGVRIVGICIRIVVYRGIRGLQSRLAFESLLLLGGLFFLARALFLSFEKCLVSCDKAPPKLY
jgi:hypothetical protein